MNCHKSLFDWVGALVLMTTAGSACAEKVASDDVFLWGAEPIIRIQPESEESKHVEYPSVFMVDGRRFMLYSAYGDDNRWRIKLAVAEAGSDFVRQGNIFDESKLPFEGAYAFPFVMVSNQGEMPLYHLYFSAADHRQRKSEYSAIYYSVSRNGLTWSSPKKILADNALDPIVITRGGKNFIVYSSLVNNTNVINSAELHAADAVGKVRTVYASASGFYTLGYVTISERPIIILETRDEWTALCFNLSGYLADVSEWPLFQIYKGGDLKWDGLKYGMHFTDTAGRPEIYYNGISAHGAEVGGQIGMGTYDLLTIAKSLNTTPCL